MKYDYDKVKQVDSNQQLVDKQGNFEFGEGILEDIKVHINIALKSFAKHEPSAVCNHNDMLKVIKKLAPIYQEISQVPFGGKMVRAKLFLESLISGISSRKNYKSNSELYDSFFNVATSLELFHTAMLIHDDIIDADVERRGRLATHVLLGQRQALLIGDFILFEADYIYNKAVLSLYEQKFIATNVYKSLIQYWSTLKRDVILGQMLDVNSEDEYILKKNTTIKKLEKMAGDMQIINSLKTISYTTVGPADIGYMIGYNITQSKLFSTSFEIERDMQTLDGHFFQLQNDIDSLESDIKKRKITLVQLEALLLCAEEDSNDKYQKFLTIILKGKKATNDDFLKAKEIVKELLIRKSS